MGMNQVTVALIGRWQALDSGQGRTSIGGVDIVRYPASGARLTRLVASRRVSWLLFGDDREDDQIESLRAMAGRAGGAPAVAILGPRTDWRRCDRWLRRGCQAYLDADSSVVRISTVLHIAAACDVVIADSCFRASEQPNGQTQLIASLTSRQTEVVRLISAGLSNRDIAATLSLSEHTVEFHVSNILGKLSARSRGEAAERARVMGL
jgi:DNA-binding NarL/FixJ family response regulator